jgi:hypothetical protein
MPVWMTFTGLTFTISPSILVTVGSYPITVMVYNGILYSTAVTFNVNVIQLMIPPVFSSLPLIDQTVVAG